MGWIGDDSEEVQGSVLHSLKPAMASEDITILCLLCPMLESKPAWKNKFVVVSVQHVASYMNTITLILSFKWKDWSWKYFPLSHYH